MNIDIKTLDVKTLEFARQLAWQFEFICKKTKEGRTLAHAYSQMQQVLDHYIGKVTEEIAQNKITLCASKDDDCGIRTFEFTISKSFLEEFLDGEQTVEEFLEEYTSDDSLGVYMQAVLEYEVINVSGDCWFNDEEN